MHHRHADVVILILTIGGSIAVTTIAALIGLRLRRRLFVGAARDQWDEARRGLSSREQRHVQWATMRSRPVSAAGLAPAQLAYISYARDSAERSPWTTSRWFRAAFPILYGLLAINAAIEGIQHSQTRFFHFVIAAGCAGLTLIWGPAMSRSLPSQVARMERLRAQINDRYGPAAASS
jgi:hypothetical protein